MKKSNTAKSGAKRPVLSFTIKLSKWRCGEGATDKACRLGDNGPQTALRDRTGRQCCLGFASRAAGFTGRMTNKLEPADLNVVLPGLTVSGDYGITNTVFTDNAMAINDSVRSTVAKKRKELIALGKKHNIVVKFIP